MGSDKAGKGLVRVSGPVKALEDPSLFDLKESLLFLLLDLLVGALEAWPLYIGQSCPLIEVIFL